MQRRPFFAQREAVETVALESAICAALESDVRIRAWFKNAGPRQFRIPYRKGHRASRYTPDFIAVGAPAPDGTTPIVVRDDAAVVGQVCWVDHDDVAILEVDAATCFPSEGSGD